MSQHTSEIELYIQARSWGDLLAEAARALAEVELSGTDCVPGGPARMIRVSSSDRDALLVDWLNELISLADIERWVAVDFTVDTAEDTAVRAQVSGVTIERASSRVKAATFHGLQVQERRGVLEARIILDV